LPDHWLNRQAESPVFVAGEVCATASALASRAGSIAAQLGGTARVVNYCEDRYAFTAVFLAALLKGIPCYLLPGRGDAYLQSIRAAVPDISVVTDSELDDVGLPVINIADCETIRGADDSIVSIEAMQADSDRIAAVVFTSGTTGVSKPLNKSVAALLQGARINAGILETFINRAQLPDSGHVRVIPTVPPWHMYGLEWSVLVPCLSDIEVYSGASFFPEDVAAAMGEPGEIHPCLLTTPHHLRAMVAAAFPFERAHTIISATAPLDPDLAAALDARVSGGVFEIYGCSEAGSVAARRAGGSFRFFDDFDWRINNNGEVVLTAGHLSEPVVLSDTIKIEPDGGFSIVGRQQDLIKVAGKRASLAELNLALQSVASVQDGMLLQPGGDDQRLAALVVTSVDDVAAIIEDLRARVDPTFLPRRICKVAKLPRNDTGKVSYAEALRLFESESAAAAVKDGGATS